MQFRPSILASALGLACLLPAVAQDGTKTRPEAGGQLRWQLEKGSRTPYTFTWLLEQTIDLKGTGMPPQQITQEVSYAVTQEIKSVEAGVASIEATIDSIRVRASMGMMGEMGFDSKNGDDAQNPLRSVRHAVGQRFTFKLSNAGKVSDVSGGDKVIKAMMDGVKADQAQGGGAQGGRGGGGGGMGGGGMGGMGMMDPEAMAQAIADQLGGVVFSDLSLSSSLKLVNECLPDDPAAKTWGREVDITVPQAGRMKFKADMSNAGEADGNVRIGVKQNGDVELEKDAGGAGGADPLGMLGETTVMRKEARGSASFSSAKGRLLDSEMVLEIESEGDLPPMLKQMMQNQGGGDLPAEMKLARTVALTLRYVQEGTASAPAAPEGEKKPAEKGSERF